MKDNDENVEEIKEIQMEENELKQELKNEVKLSDKIKNFCKKNSVLAYTGIGIAMFFLSVMLVAQMKTISNTEEVLKGKREAQLSDELVNLQRNYNELKDKYSESQKVVEEYQTNSSSNNSLIASMKGQIDYLSLLSGTTDLKGEGIIITLNDGENSNNETTRTDTLVHDSDVLTVVNELKAAGAEAISVNDQRIIASSAIRCVGPVIQVNYQKVAAPFEIKAIGNAQYLESAMNIKNGVVDMLKEFGVSVNVTREKEVKIPKYEGTFTYKNAQKDN